MRSRNLAVDIKAAREACPMVPRDVAEPLAERARLDAMDLVTDVRDLDPQQVWGRLVLWGRSEPARLIAATVALAAMVDPDMPVSDLLAWCEPLRGAA